MSPLAQGLVQVYTGPGKGKTTAALGLAMRAAGHGLRVCFIQFMKGDWDLGERKAAARLSPELEIRHFAAPRWGDRSRADEGTPWWELPPSDEDKRQAQEGILFARRALTGGDYDLVVLDEVLGAVNLELISLDELMGLICAKPPGVELVLTGREAPERVIEAADLVTEMQAVKHPYQRGVKARRGIEY
jgi:cob(I)alamin adenosyltransferase